jgi:hypothetical protein
MDEQRMAVTPFDPFVTFLDALAGLYLPIGDAEQAAAEGQSTIEYLTIAAIVLALSAAVVVLRNQIITKLQQIGQAVANLGA